MATSPYTASALLQWFSRVPRFDAQLRASTSTLDVSSLDTPYSQGIAMQAGGLVAMGALVLLGFAVALAVSRLCCRTAKAAGGCCCCCRPVSYCLLSLITFACMGGALYLFSTWRGGVTDGIAALKGFSGVLSSAAGTVSGPLAGSLASLSANALALSGACAAAGAPCSGQLPAISAVQAQAASTLADVTSLGASLASAAAGFQRSLGLSADAPFQLDAIKTAVELWVWVTLGAVAGWLLVHLATLSPTKITACMFRASTVCTLLLAAAIPVLAGGLYAVALVGSDVCVAPASTLVRLLNATGAASPLAASTLAYYTTCSAGGSGGGGDDASSQIGSASSALAQATWRVAALNATLGAGDAGVAAALAPLMAAITGDIVGANASVALLSGATLACAPVSGVYNSLLNALCGTAVTGVAQTFIPTVVASIAAVFLLCYAVSLCANHPGDGPAGEEGAEAKLIKGSGWGGEGFRASSPGGVSDWGSGARRNPSYGATSRYERSAY
jgi:hypothetical protein